MVVEWVNVAKPAGFRRTRRSTWATGTLLVAALILAVPLLMVALSTATLPWSKLADVGDAFGGVSAVLSALALSGVGASLLFQQRQIRQELADLDRQQHLELLKLAIDNPELIEVLDSETAGTTHPRHEVYANLTMSYWLAIWQLNEIDDDELRGMASAMFRSPITRRWWSRVGSGWIGTSIQPERVRFLSIITQECQAAQTVADRLEKPAELTAPTPRNTALALSGLILVAGGIAAGAAQARRRRPARTSSIKARHESDS